MRIDLGAVVIFVVGLAGLAASDEPIAATVDDLGWIAGHWRLERTGSVVEEGWLGPSGGSMLGVNRTVSGERTTGFEFLRLEEREGNVVLHASPGGRCPATEFELVECDGRRAVFANPGHDFPQTITYRRDGTELHTEISGIDNGEEKKAGWVFELMP